MDKKYRIRIHGSEFDLEQTPKNIRINNHEFKPEVFFNGKFYRVFVNGKVLRIEFKENTVFLDGKEIDFDFKPAPQIIGKKNLKHKKGSDIKAAIPGKIVEIKVKAGDKVKDQQCLLVLESMKMRNEILSPQEGIVDRVAVGLGDQVKTNQLLLKIKIG